MTAYSLPWKATKPLVPVEVSPALMLWPAPSNAKSILNFGSFCLPSLWNGPTMLSLIGPLTPSVFLASMSRERSSLPDSIFLFLPLNVSARSVSTSVSALASVTVAIAAATGGDSQRQGDEQAQQDRSQKAIHAAASLALGG